MRDSPFWLCHRFAWGVTKETYLELLQQAKVAGKFIAFDPNYREDLWKDRGSDFASEVLSLLEGVHFLKLSEEELQILTGGLELRAAVKKLHSFGAGIIAVTRGREGTYVSAGQRSAHVDSINVKSIDSTGAGDAFVGGFLYKVAGLERPEDLHLDFEKVEDLTRFANIVGALVCTKVGAMEAIPGHEDVRAFL